MLLKRRNLKTKHKIALFLVYFILFIAIFSMIDYYGNYIIPASAVFAISFFAALISAVIHAKSKTKTKADELAKEVEEII